MRSFTVQVTVRGRTLTYDTSAPSSAAALGDGIWRAVKLAGSEGSVPGPGMRVSVLRTV